MHFFKRLVANQMYNTKAEDLLTVGLSNRLRQVLLNNKLNVDNTLKVESIERNKIEMDIVVMHI